MEGNSSALRQDVLDKVAVRLLPFMFLLYVVAYLDRINVSFAGLQMNRDLGFDDAVFGLGAGVFFLGYFLFGVPSNLMVERVGARRWISIIMIAWGFVSLGMATVNSQTMFYSLRFLLGVAEAGFFPGMILYLTYWFPKRQMGLAVARFMTAVPAAGVLGGLVAAVVPSMNGMLGLAGWKWLFLTTGSLPILLGALAFFLLSDKPSEAKWLSEEERTWLAGVLNDERKKQSGNKSVGLTGVLLNGRVWYFACLYFMLTIGMYGFQLWLPQIINGVERTNDSTVALLSIIPAVFQALGMLIVAGNSDRTGERRMHLALSATLAGVALAVSAYLHERNLAIAALSLTAFGIWGTVGPFWALPASYLSPAVAASGIAFINSVGNLGGFAGPYIVGLIKHQFANFTYALMAVSSCLVFAAVLALRASKEGS